VRIAAGLIMSRGERRIEQRFLRIVRAHADGSLDMVDGSVGATVEGERTAEKAVRGGEVRVEIERALKFLDRLVSAPPGEADEAQREMRPRITIVEFHHPGGDASVANQLTQANKRIL
jgi:hypothetical protein